MPRHLCIIGVFVLLFGFAGSPQAKMFSSVVVFGDSLSDSGNLAQFQGLPAGTSFTTNPDPIWSEIVAQAFGASGTNSLAGGLNYAWGGSCVNPDGPCVNQQVPTTEKQIDQYLSGGRADPDALHMLWGGANDVEAVVLAALADPQANPQSGTVAAARAYVGQISRLRDAGARHIVVFNLPDLGVTPYALRATALDPRISATLSALSRVYNEAVVTGLRSREDGIIPVNISALLGEVIESPRTYGFTDIRGVACPFGSNPARPGGGAESLVCGPRASGYLVSPAVDENYFFADGVHPSGTGHAVIANMVTSTLSAPVQISLAGEGGSEVVGFHRDAVSVERTLDFGLDRPAGSWRVYVKGRIGVHDLDALPRLGKTQADMRVLTLGANYRAWPEFYWGAALSLGRHDNDVSGASLGSTVVIGSLHGTWLLGDLYLSGGLSGGRTSVNIERSVPLGLEKRAERGSTRADQFGAELELGWILGQSEGYRHDLFLGLAWLDQKIDGYRERGSSSTSMNFSDFYRDSLIARAGYQLIGSLGPGGVVRPYIRVAYENEFYDDPVLVTAGSNTMPGRFTVSGFTPPRRWVSTGIGLTVDVGEQASVFAGYFGRFGSESRQDHGLNLGLRFAF